MRKHPRGYRDAPDRRISPEWASRRGDECDDPLGLLLPHERERQSTRHRELAADYLRHRLRRELREEMVRLAAVLRVAEAGQLGHPAVRPYVLWVIEGLEAGAERNPNLGRDLSVLVCDSVRVDLDWCRRAVATGLLDAAAYVEDPSLPRVNLRTEAREADWQERLEDVFMLEGR